MQKWPFSVLNDAFLEPYVSGYRVAPTIVGVRDYTWLENGDSAMVVLSSLNQEAYSFYKTLIEQFKNDGGAYKPVPMSPPTNLSNGALGLFRASAVSENRSIVE
jgi:hypothetical protein